MPNSVTGDIRSESYVGGVIYQESAEVAALYKQAFDLATIKLDKEIAANGGTGEGLAIATDIDATLMDDSTYFAGALLDKAGREALGLDPWNNDDWCGYYAAVATDEDIATPGAYNFLKKAYDAGVEIYYITNRPYYELDLTVKQLQHAFGDIIPAGKFDLYENANLEKNNKIYDYDYVNDDEGPEAKALREEITADEEDGLVMGTYYYSADDYLVQVQGTYYSSDKAERRANVKKAVKAKYGDDGKVIMYMGDSINDMVSKNEYKYEAYTDVNETGSANKNIDDVVKKGKPTYRAFDFDRTNGNANRTTAATDDYWYNHWGDDFIVMPNSAYGDWQKATWFKKSLDNDGQIQAIKDQLNAHSYLKSKTWYDGNSPIGADVQ